MSTYHSNQCMSCGFEPDWAIENWEHILIDLGENGNEYPVAIQVCRACGTRGPQKALEGYQKRIRSGADINFH